MFEFIIPNPTDTMKQRAKFYKTFLQVAFVACTMSITDNYITIECMKRDYRAVEKYVKKIKEI